MAAESFLSVWSFKHYVWKQNDIHFKKLESYFLYEEE